MAGLKSSMVIKKMPMHANMTEMNHLGTLLAANPYKFEGVMTQLFTTQMFSDNTLTTFLTQAGVKEKIIPADSWTWNLETNTRRPTVVIGDTQPLNLEPCKGRNTAELYLDENWWLSGDVIHPMEGDGKYQVRIVNSPRRQGKGWVYTVQAMNDQLSFFIPKRYFAQNVRWNKLFAKYGEGSEQSGSTQYNMPIELGPSRVSMLRKQYSVTGDAANETLKISLTDKSGKTYDTWVKYAELKYWQQWYKECEANAFYSRSTNTVLDANGRPVQSGAGMFELFEDAHTHRYSVLTATLIREFVQDIFYNRVAFAKRNLDVFTGEYGMTAFSDAINNATQASGFIPTTDMGVMTAKSEMHGNSKSFGYQFVRYEMANGATVTVRHAPILDDREYNSEIDPVTGAPTQSMRFLFMDFGSSIGDNIKLVTRENSLKSGYEHGLQTPYGVNNGKPMSHSGDYYTMHVQKKSGIQITDISRCGQLILSRAR